MYATVNDRKSIAKALAIIASVLFAVGFIIQVSSDYSFNFWDVVLALCPYILVSVFAVCGKPRHLLTAAFASLAIKAIPQIIDAVREINNINKISESFNFFTSGGIYYSYTYREDLVSVYCFAIFLFIIFIACFTILAVCAYKDFSCRRLFKVTWGIALFFSISPIFTVFLKNFPSYGFSDWVQIIANILLQIALLLFGLEASSVGGSGYTVSEFELLDDKLKYGIISEEEYRRRRAAIDPTYTAADKETDDIAAVLRNLENNLKYGLITEEEYSEKRAEILKKL